MPLVKLFNIDFVYGPRCGDDREQRAFYYLCCLGHATMERLMIGLADEAERRSQNAGPEFPLDEREKRRLNWASLIIK